MPGFPRVAQNWEVFETQSPDGVLPGPARSCLVLPGLGQLWRCPAEGDDVGCRMNRVIPGFVLWYLQKKVAPWRSGRGNAYGKLD